VSFPDVFVKRVFEGQGEESGRYSCAALFSGFEVKDGRTIIKAPAAWPEKDQQKWNALVAACNKVSLEAFKKPMKDLDRAVYKLPFHRGEEKEYDGYGPGVVYFTMSAKNRRPGIIDRDGAPITHGGPVEFYAGCYARASVTPFANLKWTSLSIGLNNLQKLADGVRLDADTSPEDDFGADPAKYHAQQLMWTVSIEITTPQSLSLAISIAPATIASRGQRTR
jgi:Enterobacter phage Enc34, ssDNA-binding protein